MKKLIRSRLNGSLFFICFIMLTGCSSNPINAEKAKASSYNAQLGAEYLRKGRLHLANEKLTRALEQDNGSAEAHHYFAVLQQNLNRKELADKHFKWALKIKPTSELHNNYGSFLCKNREFDKAQTQFQAALENPLYRTPEFAYTNAGICAMDVGNIALAKSYFTKALSKNNNFYSALLEMSQIYNLEGDYSRAQAYLYRYNGLVGDSERSLKLCQKIHKNLGEVHKAEECFSKLSSKYPNSN